MFLKTQPIGVNVPRDSDRLPIWSVISGDDWMLTTKLSVPEHPEIPLTPASSRVVFVLAQDRFSKTPLWTGQWNDGIQPVASAHPGLVSIRIPDTVAATLRRGSYAFSVSVADKFGRNRQTQLRGTLQVEYEPTSPQHNIPYRRDS